MAISATFTADFRSFYDAVDKAKIKLGEFAGGADKAGEHLDRMAQQFSGQKIVQEATLMVKAIGGVEGIAKLTEKEMARLGATTNEAVEKLTKLGKPIEKSLQDVANATKGADKASTDWMGTLTKMAGVVGVAFSIEAIANFAGSVINAASEVKDLSMQLGFSLKATQQFNSAAKDAGISTEALSRSVLHVTDKLSENSTEYQAFLRNIGLSAEALRKMSMEDAYRLILEKISLITDKTLQLDVATSLLGPTAKQMIGGIRDGYVEAIDKQKVFADDTVKRLDEASKEWKKLKDNVKIYSGEMFNEVMKHTRAMTKSWGDFFSVVSDYVQFGPAVAAANLKAKESADDAAASYNTWAASMVPVASHGDDINEGLETEAQIRARLARDEKARQKAQQEAEAAAASAKKAQDDYNKMLEAQDKALNDLMDTFSSRDVIGKANQYLQALKMSIPIEQMTAKQKENINKVIGEAIGAYQAMGQMAPKVLYDVYQATEKLHDSTANYAEDLSHLNFGAIVNTLPIDLGPGVSMAPPPGMFAGFGEGVVSAISSSIMRAIEGGGNVFAAVGATIGNYILDPKQSGIGVAIKTAAEKLPGFLGNAISTAIPLVGPLIAPAVEWLSKKITSWFGQKEHNKIRDQFIIAAGGFDVLAESARKAGTNIEALLQAKNTGAVTKAAEELQKALDFQATAYDKLVEVTEKYGFTIEELGPAMARQELDVKAQELFKDWEVLNSAGIDTVAITERMGESVSEYVQQAMKMGTEVPVAMRPMLEAMVKSGTLIDANDEAITDLEDSGISFAMSMSEGFRALIDEVKLLTDAIARSLNIAIRDIPQPKIKGEVTWDVQKIDQNVAARDAYKETQVEGYARGTGGFKNFGAGTPVILHGWEAVVPRDDAMATVTSGGGGAVGAMPTIIVNAQGAFFSTPADLQRLADKVGDALTAKYSVMGKLRAAV